MNAAAWSQLAERSRALVYHASSLMGILTHPTLGDDSQAQAAIAARVEQALKPLIADLAAVPELRAHERRLRRFVITLSAWERSVGAQDVLSPRYRTALLQQAAQLLISCLHVERLAASECVRVDLSLTDVIRPSPPALDARRH